MERIYRTDYRQGVVASKDPEKGAILAYLSKVKPAAVAAGYFTDAVTGELMVGIDNMGYIDGDFSWSTGDVYHFEKYDHELSPAFREHALTH